MSRLSFLLFGGDIREPFLRRMVFRLGVSSLAIGAAFGFFAPGADPLPRPVAIGLAVAVAVYAAILVAEFRRYYQHSDEMARRVLTASLAVSGLVVMAASGLYGVLDLAFSLPEISMLHVFFFSAIVSSIAWFAAAWKNS